MNTPPPLLLASSSPYRRQQLKQLNLKFEWDAPSINETPHTNERPDKLASRLAEEKAQALAAQYSKHLIISGDQTATLDGKNTLSKPGNFENARQQLTQCQNQTVYFYSSLCVYKPESGKKQTKTTETTVKFRQLSDRQIQSYLLKEQPYDCAGSFKCEGLGIALFESITSSDPSALIGLPLIALTSCLTFFDYDVMTHQ